MNATHLKSGLLSVTFRDKTTEEIIEMVRGTELHSIEWGGDVHVPPGGLETARKVGEATRAAGLKVSAYGSYFKFEEDRSEDARVVGQVIDTACALETSLIRIWAGIGNSIDFTPEKRREIVERTRFVADLAADRGVTIGTEYHPNTLTDCIESAERFFQEVDHPNVKSFWQPGSRITHQDHLDSLRRMLPYVCNVHVFNWTPHGVPPHDHPERLPLAEGAAKWAEFIEILRTTGRSHFLSLEFVREEEDAVAQFEADAETLVQLLS